MATYNKFNVFVEDFANKIHDVFGTAALTDDLKIYLSNQVPTGSQHAVKSNVPSSSGLSEITVASGYAGAIDLSTSGNRVSGTSYCYTPSGSCTVNAVGNVGPFRYVVLYNDTPTNPVDPLIAWWDYETPITLASGESFTVTFATSGVLFSLT
jgi:hypothetical protein